ncbi:MAG TPA: hypothetical protein VHX38_26375 [Pseudonocardiaceae bacterium]|jgi:hypothetical protein|nr:hypothetical protein [Pseudonocardiaceae bacterium]
MTQESPDESDEIQVFGIEDAGADRALFWRTGEFRYSRTSISIDSFKQRVAAFLDAMQSVVDQAPQQTDGFTLEEVQIAVEVSAKGQLSILGNGGELASKGGMTLTFKRSTHK